HLEGEKVKNFCSLIEKAMEQKHGTMLIISDHANEEAERLEKQSTRVKSRSIDDELMESITAIDGAVLLDTEGQCHAIGVILDGTMERGKGEPSRGARYNAAVKYLSYARQRGHKVVIVVVSEDGMVDIFPKEPVEHAQEIIEVRAEIIEEQLQL